MIRRLFFICIFPILLAALPVWAEQVEVEQQVRDIQPGDVQTDGNIYIHSYYEHSWVSIGSRDVRWKVLRTRVALLNGKLHQPYFETSLWERDGNEDYTFDLGTYFRAGKGYGFVEVGRGSSVDYVAENQLSGEYTHPIKGGLHGRFSYRFADNKMPDVQIFSPGLIYYFDNHYVRLDYGITHTGSRGNAYWGALKGNFVLNERVELWGGTALGERLFDISEDTDASQQDGYIVFVGADYSLNPDVRVRLGFSYSEEDPNFIKRSVDLGARILF